MQKQYSIAVLGGDGIGPEVMTQAVDLLKAMEPAMDGLGFAFEQHSVGVGEYQRSGNALPDASFDACRRCDAVLLGAMGLPNVRYPDGKEIAPQLDLRERLELFGGVRPIQLFNQADSPLKGYQAGGIDFVLVRESTEGLFAGREATFDPDADFAENVMRISRKGAQRVCRLAFEVAQQRDRERRVTLIDKANVLSSMVFFREVFDTVAKDFPDCKADHCYVDAASLFLVRSPEQFDVMVTENMFGDILSDLAAGLVGGMGMAPSGDIGADAAVFQPSHGSAPDIAGKGVANPIAMILSAAMMLQWFDHPEANRGAAAIRSAISDVFEDTSFRTPDMGGAKSTSEMGQAVREATLKRLSGVSAGC